MAKIRAYKLAEELGLEKSDLVEKAEGLGVVLKSAMATVGEEDAELLRKKLGSRKSKKLVTESRVEAKGGAIIRRRKRAAPEPPPPEPEPEEVAPPVVEPEPAVAEAVPEEAPPAEPAVEEPPAESPVDLPTPEPIAAEAAPEVPAEAPAAPSPVAREKERPAVEAPDSKSGRQRKLVREVVNLKEQEQLARQAIGHTRVRRQVQIDPRTATSPRRKRRDALAPKRAAKATPKESTRVVRIEKTVSVGELARLLGVKAPEVQRKLMALGTMVSINQEIDLDTAKAVAAEFNHEVEDVGFREEQYLEDTSADAGKMQPRPPVITVMGHVDHGKTTLLDALRETNVVEGEAGGITQHIGAYQVEVGGKKLTFIDTPGHAAFTDMRARGAQVTDIVIIVIAATEGIMPQTIEAIEHSKAAGVSIVVAVNKCDLPGANPQAARQRLMEYGLVPEEFGGDTICVDISAKKKTGLDKLLEMVNLQAEVLELEADPKRRAVGIVLESQLDTGRGPVATVLVQQGTLKTGETFVVGTCTGRVRALEDERGKRVKSAGPSMPVRVIGLSGVPEAGQILNVVESERAAREIIENRVNEQRRRPDVPKPSFTLDEFFERMDGGGVKELPVVIKGDVHGSVEALRDALLKLSTDSVKVNVILSGVGAITKDDVMLSKASSAIILGFHVRPDPLGRKAAEEHGVDIRVYKVIYEIIDEVKQAMAGLLPPTIEEKAGGRAEVRELFTVPKVGRIAGSMVAEGTIRRGATCRLIRDGVQIYEGKVGSLKRFKDDAREVNSGFECGIGIEGYNDIKVGDVIETFSIEEKPATLE
ncbi:MAG: translation initiation factor IF-2 [Deltaproteobacteria bacterium]|nr:translation initiation factor IF-2 [Deltaproteobacteria bacterium]MBW2541703.1 translation initiation factor IF-2 [Deltaproteobacteria bacterium]